MIPDGVKLARAGIGLGGELPLALAQTFTQLLNLKIACDQQCWQLVALSDYLSGRRESPRHCGEEAPHDVGSEKAEPRRLTVRTWCRISFSATSVLSI
jgi:hypothetical protein